VWSDVGRLACCGCVVRESAYLNGAAPLCGWLCLGRHVSHLPTTYLSAYNDLGGKWLHCRGEENYGVAGGEVFELPRKRLYFCLSSSTNLSSVSLVERPSFPFAMNAVNHNES